ncbi:DUF4396 domain-containing protein [Kocuria marina]|uniref:DUF4396 domain-containing protein n=1 Tax=Kocuria marina TaxID=223184 RepID=UPI0021B2E7AB|nr:DUF4396 domain-containing protein [Kocuria indica]
MNTPATTHPTDHSDSLSGHDMHDHAPSNPAGHDMSNMAASATLHCLTGCSIGEILGLILATVFGWGNVTSTATDTVSILTMEVVDNLVMWLVPGAMDAGLLDALFWGSMALSLVIAYFAAYPVNKALLRRGKGHAITHHASGGGPMDNRPLAYGISAFMLGGFVASLGTLL